MTSARPLLRAAAGRSTGPVPPVYFGGNNGNFSTTTGSTLSLPASTHVGDVAFLNLVTVNTVTITVPGYTALPSAGATTTHSFYRVYNGTSADNVTINCDASPGASAAALTVYRGADPVSPIEAYDVTTASSGSSRTTATLTSVTANPLLIIAGMAVISGTTTTSFSPGNRRNAAVNGTRRVDAGDAAGPSTAGGTSTVVTISTVGTYTAITARVWLLKAL